MSRRIALPLATLIAMTLLAPEAPRAQSGNDPESLLNAEAWYLTWETSFDATYQGTENVLQMGLRTTTTTLKRVFSGSRALTLRNMGAVLSAPKMDPTKDASKMSMAEMQKMSQEMMASWDTKANWMESAPDENADMKAVLAANEGPANLDYVSDTVGDDLVDEAGSPYKLHIHTTRTGAGPVLAGQMSFFFEIDSAAKKYYVTVPYAFNDMHAQDEITEEVVTTVTPGGGAPSVERKTSKMGIELFPVVQVDDASQTATGYVVLSGDLDASGKVTGQQTVKAHCADGGTTMPGTLTFRYTLTRTPPEKSE